MTRRRGWERPVADQNLVTRLFGPSWSLSGDPKAGRRHPLRCCTAGADHRDGLRGPGATNLPEAVTFPGQPSVGVLEGESDGR